MSSLHNGHVSAEPSASRPSISAWCGIYMYSRRVRCTMDTCQQNPAPVDRQLALGVEYMLSWVFASYVQCKCLAIHNIAAKPSSRRWRAWLGCANVSHMNAALHGLTELNTPPHSSNVDCAKMHHKLKLSVNTTTKSDSECWGCTKSSTVPQCGLLMPKGYPLQYCHKVGTKKTRMLWLPDGKKVWYV